MLSYFCGPVPASGTGHRNWNSDSLPPVETKSPNSDYKPAFVGQTRIAGASTSTPYTVDKIADKLGHPFAIVAMPDFDVVDGDDQIVGIWRSMTGTGRSSRKITGFPEVAHGAWVGCLM